MARAGHEVDAALAALPADFAQVDGEQVVDLLRRFQDHPDLERLLDELDRREQVAHPWGWNAVETAQDRQVTDLIAAGVDHLDAYAQVYELDLDQLHRQETLYHLAAERRPGERADDVVRRLYGTWLDVQYIAAENATRGVLVNKLGRARGIDGRSLMSGPARRSRAYASDELKAWWQTNPRMTQTEFRAQLLRRDADLKAARRTREDRT